MEGAGWTEMGSCAMSMTGRGSKGVAQGQSGIALPSDLDISSVLLFYTHRGRHLSLCIFFSPELRCHWRERQGKKVCGTAPGSLRQIPPSVQQQSSSKPGKSLMWLQQRGDRKTKGLTLQKSSTVYSHHVLLILSAAAVSDFSTAGCSYRNCCQQ